MKILDQNDQEITDPDMEKGYLVEDVEYITHPAIEGREEQFHYEPCLWVIEDAQGNRREHHIEQGQPEFGENDTIFGVEEHKVIDVEGIKPVDEWVEAIEILRYVEYSESDITAMNLAAWKEELASFAYIGTMINMGLATEDQYATEMARAKELMGLIQGIESVPEPEPEPESTTEA